MPGNTMADNWFISALRQTTPQATAELRGNENYPQLYGIVRLYQTPYGVLVCAEVAGLPSADSPCGTQVFGFHIHEGTACTGSEEDPFADALTHYNPSDCPHPAHAGDLPPLFGNRGFALSVFLTDRFRVEEVVGRALIIHDRPDDFTSQPAGNSGEKIACGLIRG